MKAAKRFTLALGGSALLAVAWAGACMDLTPVEVTPKLAETDATVSDAFLTDAPEDALSPCEACLARKGDAAPGCGADLATCVELPECQNMLGCVLERGCLALPFNQIVSCGIPCAAEAGITSLDDPALKPLFVFGGCARVQCGDLCGFPRDVGDAAIE